MESFFATLKKELVHHEHYRTHSGHSGLGLAIVQAIVENHQGSVAVESVPGAGATFRVCLPALGS